jgi:hypothetical protein
MGTRRSPAGRIDGAKLSVDKNLSIRGSLGGSMQYDDA